MRHRRQRRRERRATANVPRVEATAPTIARREREPPSTTHERASRCRGTTATERYAVASAAARPSQRQER